MSAAWPASKPAGERRVCHQRLGSPGRTTGNTRPGAAGSTFFHYAPFPLLTFSSPGYSMLPALRTLASAKLAWHLVAETVAPGAVPTTHPRLVRGETKQVVRRPKKLVSNGAKVTGDRLLTLGRQGAQRLLATPALWSAVVLTDAGVAELPPVYTNGPELAAHRGVTDRTIRTHVQQLKQAGLITRYRYRGTHADYCVWINPDFVWETALAGHKTSAPEPAASEGQGKNLPLIEILESLEAPKCAISGVEKLVTPEAPAGGDDAGLPLTGSAGPPPGSTPAVQVSKSGAGGAGAARAERFYQRATARGSGAKTAAAKRLVESFWHYAKALVYKGKTFNEEAERQAKNAIWRGVFGGFSQGEPAEWLTWMPGLQRRLELAAAWLARNPGKWPAAPYAEVVAGRGYFDAGNGQGFAATERWWRDEQRHHAQGAVERALDEALAELAQRRALDAGQRRVQASPRARQKELLELHRFHWVKLRRLGGDEALRRLAARLEAERLLTRPV